MSNTRKIQPITVWSASGQVQVNCLALNNFLQSNVKYILTTNCVTDTNHTNLDIKTGDWRSLNLFLPPFNFPTNPLWEIDDYSEPHPPMKLCLWHRDQLIELLPIIQNSIRT